VTLLFSGRPVSANDLINNSDAFVAAWLPGTEGLGLTDMLFAGKKYNFTGRLSFEWPAGNCLPQQGGVQFRRGYGLSLSSKAKLGKLPESQRSVACPPQTR
jgi:beta-glucosidase